VGLSPAVVERSAQRRLQLRTTLCGILLQTTGLWLCKTLNIEFIARVRPVCCHLVSVFERDHYYLNELWEFAGRLIGKWRLRVQRRFKFSRN
jgi:hypothetical protein